jgi:hypothetical protein
VLLAAEVDPASLPPWAAIVVAVITFIGVCATAFAPALLERIKRRRARGTAESGSEAAALPPAPAVVQRTDQALDLVGDAMVDARRERDEAQTENRALLKKNARLVQENADLRTLIYRLDPTWNGEIRGRSPH